MIDVRVEPNWISMLLVFVSVVILYFILKHFLYEPVSKFMGERKENIQKDIDGAKSLKEDATVLRNQYEIKIEESYEEGQKIIETSRRRGEELREDIIKDAEKEAEGIVDRARREIELEKEKALQEIKLQAGDMAILIASRIVDEKMDMNVQQEMIDKFVNEVGMEKWQS
ncbi:MAG TPA: F0F1 ATP synthase subunit B [Tissierellales bacterium]|nr:F0F1 ATP synthase subunit B [Tissierellales bacterium]